MGATRDELRGLLERHYRSHGWRVTRCDDGTVRASGLGDVTWIGVPVVSSDLSDKEFPARLVALGEERTADGRRCPLEILPGPKCSDDLHELLHSLQLDERGHVEVYASTD